MGYAYLFQLFKLLHDHFWSLLILHIPHIMHCTRLELISGCAMPLGPWPSGLVLHLLTFSQWIFNQISLPIKVCLCERTLTCKAKTRLSLKVSIFMPWACMTANLTLMVWPIITRDSELAAHFSISLRQWENKERDRRVYQKAWECSLDQETSHWKAFLYRLSVQKVDCETGVRLGEWIVMEGFTGFMRMGAQGRTIADTYYIHEVDKRSKSNIQT